MIASEACRGKPFIDVIHRITVPVFPAKPATGAPLSFFGMIIPGSFSDPYHCFKIVRIWLSVNLDFFMSFSKYSMAGEV
jgi:hypothetical protein